jgi:hypothetical protein
MGDRTKGWRVGHDAHLGWEVLSNPANGVYSRDWQDNYYYLFGVCPTTWRQIADPGELVELKRVFQAVYGY